MKLLWVLICYGIIIGSIVMQVQADQRSEKKNEQVQCLPTPTITPTVLIVMPPTVPYSPTPVSEASPSASVTPVLPTANPTVATPSAAPTTLVPNAAPFTGRAE